MTDFIGQYLPLLQGLTTEILISAFLCGILVMLMYMYVGHADIVNECSNGMLYEGINATLDAPMGSGLTGVYAIVHLNVRQGLKFWKWLNPLGWCIDYFNYKRRMAIFDALREDQIEVLRPYILTGGKTTQYFDSQNGVVADLVKKGILYKAVTTIHNPSNVAFNIEDWARDLLKKNKYLLGIDYCEELLW
jgi:hypothetical protein